MKILIVGATGATGKLLVTELLSKGHSVTVIVRSRERLPNLAENQGQLSVIEASILELSDLQLMKYVENCDAVVSCLGHNMSFKGLYGKPRKLVRDATANLCRAIKAKKANKSTKYLLMNTAGNSNRDLPEVVSFAQKCVLAMIRVLVPPHLDNEMAADYLRLEIGPKDKQIEWTVIRPDSLLDEDHVTPYDVYPSPTSSAIFNPGRTSRINVSRFMADLIIDEDLWKQWEGKMPVIYNQESRS